MFPFRVFQNTSARPQQNSSSHQPRVPSQTLNQPNKLPYFSTGSLPSRAFGTEIHSSASYIENIQYKELHPFVYQRIEEDRLAKKQERELLDKERKARLRDEESEVLRTQEVKVRESIELLQEVVPKLPESELKALKEKTKQAEKKIKEELNKREYQEGAHQQPF